MNRLLKYSLFAAAAIVLILAGGMAYLIATFNPNDFKPQIIKAVDEKLHRNLRLDGDIKLTFFPSIGASLSKVSLSEFRSEQKFAAIDSVHVSLALLPLFAKQAVIDAISINGMTLHLIRHKDGKLNIDDLKPSSTAPAAPASPPPAGGGVPVKLDVASVNITNASLSYSDEGTGARYEVKDLDLSTGRISSGVPTKVELKTSIQTSKPRMDVSLQLHTSFTFDLSKMSYRLDNFDLQGHAKGDIGDIAAALSLPELQGDQHSLKITGLNFSTEVKQPEQTFKVKLSSPLNGNFETQQFELPALKLAVNATGDKLPGKSINSEMNGNIRLNLQKQEVAVKLAGGLLQSQIKADVAMNNFSSPSIRFSVDADQFDADPYLPKTRKEDKTVKQAAGPEQPFDLSALKTLNLDGSLHVGALKAFNVKVQQLRMGVKARNGDLSIAPLAADLYKGSMDGKVSINAKTSAFTFNAKLTGIEIGPLMKDAADLDMADGKGNVTLDLTTHGNTVTGLKQALNGNASVNLTNGAIKGIDLAKLVSGVQSLSKESSVQTLGVDKNARTEFTQFHASFRIHNGVAHNDDLAVHSTVLRMGGSGDIDIGQGRIDYNAKAIFAKTEQGRTATLPVYVSGTFDNPRFKVDYGAMLADVARQKLDEKKEELKAKAKEDARKQLEEQLKGGLKGLFK